MKRRTLTPLGEAEMEVLGLVWELKEATVADVHAHVTERRPVAYTTVMTLLKKLADKGYLRYRKEGAAYVYSADRPPEEVRGGVLAEILEKVWRGSPVALVQTLVRQENLSDEERAEIQALINRLGADDLDDEPQEGAP